MRKPMDSWNADFNSLQTRLSMIHGWGKLHGSGELPTHAFLEIRCNDIEVIEEIPLSLGKAERTKDEEVSIDFFIFGKINTNSNPQQKFFLTLQWDDDHQFRIPVLPPQPIIRKNGFANILALPWKHYFKCTIKLIRQRQMKLLLRKMTSMAQTFFFSGWDPARLLYKIKNEGAPLVLVIDHDLGGGANIYRESLTNRLKAEGFSPILLTCHHGILAYRLSSKRGRWTRSAHIEDLSTLFDALAKVHFDQVVFNNIVSFPDPLAFVTALTNWLTQKNGQYFLFLMHDHYSICPSWLLLDNTFKFCGIPHISVCLRCLPSNRSRFIEFSKGADIVVWRNTWKGLLERADEIRCFCTSSRNFLIRAYPCLNQERIKIVPHTLEHVKLRKIILKDSGYPVIGIIGQISFQKGSKVVYDLANFIHNSGENARIVVIGTIEHELPEESSIITGPYEPQNLPDLLETNGINIGFFPSICPETFSFVTEEMMQMGLPIVAFDLGAPAERIEKYPMGHIIPINSDPKEIIMAVNELYQKYIRNQVG